MRSKTPPSAKNRSWAFFHEPATSRTLNSGRFGEFAKTFANDGRLFYLKKRNLVRKNGKLQKSQIAEVRYPNDASSLGLSLLGFGQGGDGELYLLGNSTAAPAGATGVVVKISEP